MTDPILEAYGFPSKRYDIIYADPPWSYEDKANSGQRGASHKYPCMDLQDLMALPVKRLAADNCVLFMWHVGPMPMEAIKVAEAWGFKVRTFKAFTWVKLNKRFASAVKKAFDISNDELMAMEETDILDLMHSVTKMGMGSWTRANTEDMLVATRGRPKRIHAGIKQVVHAPYPGCHSEKPDIFRQRIVQIAGDKPRIELFSRGRYDGWDVWGNEVPEIEDQSLVKVA